MSSADMKVSTVLRYPMIKNRRFFNYLKENEYLMLKNTCVSENEAIEHYNGVYKQIIATTQDMYRHGYIKKSGKKLIFGLLKSGNLNKLYIKIVNLNLLQVNSATLAEKEYLTALAGELNFINKNLVYNSFDKAISLNLFNVKYHFARSEFLFKNCDFDGAIDGLLTAKSIIANSNDTISMYKNYKLLGDIYFIKGDYENSLAYYTNTLILGDFHEIQKNKLSILSAIGRIMYFRGDLSESINYYKYAVELGIGKRMDGIKVILALSNSYYVYGDYDNSLKFADLALKKLRKNDDRLLAAKAYVLKCLNYERVNERKMMEKYCGVAMKNLLERYRKNDDFEINNLLGSIFSSVPFFRDKIRAERYYLAALNLAEENIVKKISVLEKLVSLYARNHSNRGIIINIIDEINKYRRQYGLKHNYNNDFLLGKSEIYSGQGNCFYCLRAEDGFKNQKTRLFALYTYMTNFYRNIDVDLADKYREKSIKLSEQLYKYGSHNTITPEA
ncbi:MAG: tetratricopeptide repeat protein [Rickettsiales bacterium]|nr:tetratricopeptide repeat protein [Rickettsiales bacterium]